MTHVNDAGCTRPAPKYARVESLQHAATLREAYQRLAPDFARSTWVPAEVLQQREPSALAILRELWPALAERGFVCSDLENVADAIEFGYCGEIDPFGIYTYPARTRQDEQPAVSP